MDPVSSVLQCLATFPAMVGGECHVIHTFTAAEYLQGRHDLGRDEVLTHWSRGDVATISKYNLLYGIVAWAFAVKLH